MSNRAWVTLATNDSYGLGALVLAHSLRRVASTHSTVVLITPSVTDAMRDRLRAVFTEVVTVDVLDSRDAAHLALLQRPELGITFTKIHCWGLTQYEKCVFLDADTLVVQNCDELFEREELSAAPDVGWPDCFNSGVFVYKPSTETFDALIKFAQERGSFDGGDQGLLNSFFSDWARGDISKHLPFLYNVTSAAFYSYLPALKQYGQDLKIIHFIGSAKPWLQPYNWESRSVDAPDHIQGLLQLWWDIFVGQVHHRLDSNMVEDVEVATPALPPSDVAQHYAPSLDPQSEFRWHHPDAQVPDEALAEISITDYYDPWQNYRGNIPPNPNLEATDDRQAVRDYAWEYIAPAQNPNAWQPPSDNQHDTNWHNDPHHHTHSHDHKDHQSDHSHIHTHGHHTDEHHGWYQEHEAGPFLTGDDNSAHHHHSKHEHGQNGHTHTQYPHDHHYDHTSHPHHDDYNFEEKHEAFNDSQKHKDFENTHVNCITNHSRIHIVHHVHIDYENTPNEISETDVPVPTEEINGVASETESCDHEDIKPRHPYDNFYLIHRAAIDPYGKKICSHEIPPTPSPSPPPESMSPLYPEEEIDESPVENQSGVAGNLARVVPGAVARDAVDELTRRQGWEAGNIDYMGADSFDNIWAKISQTLNQPRQSPPKQSPPRELKQPSPPKEPAPKQASPPKETAVKEASPPKETAAKQASPPKETAAKQPSPPKETAAKQPSPPKEPAPKQPSPPKEAEAEPAEIAVEAKPAEVPAEAKPTEAPAAEKQAEKPAGKPTPVSPAAEAPAPADAAAPVETPLPAPEAPAVAAAEAPKQEIEKTDKPEVPPTPPATPKSTPEPSRPVVEVPAVVEALLQAAPLAGIEAPAAAAPAAGVPATPEKPLDGTTTSSDSPPLANTPAKEEAPAVPAKSEERERRKPAEKLQLSPPVATDPLATPDSELEDAAALAHAIIASELTPDLSAPAPVSLAQIGVKPKGKSTAAQIESSVAPSAEAPATPKSEVPVTPSEKAPATPSAEAPPTPSAEAPATPSAEAPCIQSAKAPATPSSEASATAKAEIPFTPSAEAPATPSAKAPSTLSGKTPATPSAEGPCIQSAKASATPSLEASATAKAEISVTPSAEAPATPSAKALPTLSGKTPATPSAEAPCIQSTKAPATPSSEASATAKAEITVTPSAEAPATPSTKVSPTPSGKAPVAPSAEAPSIQSAKAPATPSSEASAISKTEVPVTPSAEAPATPSAEAPSTPSAEAPATPSTEATATPSAEAPASPAAEAAPKDAPKKKIVKKVVKKEGDAPVPPPRKKEKKPKDK